MTFFRKLKENYHTRNAVYKTINYIKKNNSNAFKMGSEIAKLYYLIFTSLRNDERLHFGTIYYHIVSNEEFLNTNLSTFFNEFINFEIYFSRLNMKLLSLNTGNIWDYLRGYYINELDMFTYNIYCDKDKYWLVLYDFHEHYLQYIFNSVESPYLRNEVHLLLNNENDPYSISELSEELTYKIVFEHDTANFKDSIRDILELFYMNTSGINQIYSKEDENLFNQYIAYVNN